MALDDLLNSQDIGPILAILLISALFVAYYNGETRRLKHIPSVGSDLPILSWINAYRYQVRIKDIITEGVQKCPNGIFKAPDALFWQVIVTGEKYIDEFYRIQEATFSSIEFIEDFIMVRHTFDPHMVNSPRAQFPLIRTRLTKELTNGVAAMHDETLRCLGEVLPKDTNQWTPVTHTQELLMRIISQVSNRVFVGLPLCRNPEWIELTSNRTMDVFMTATVLKMVPAPLRGPANLLMPKAQRQVTRATELLDPIVQARRKALSEGDSEVSDFLTWLIEGAEGRDQETRILVCRLLILNFASLHTTSMSLANALYTLAVYGQYVDPLREEITEAVRNHGWTREGLDAMHKLDSFIKETQRMDPTSELLMSRIAMKDFTFSDGTYIPKGTFIAAAIRPVHQDQGIYMDPGPDVFDGLRFYKLRGNENTRKYDISSTSPSFLAFGHGPHACPGRFFVAYEMKLLLAHIVLGYDLKMETAMKGVKPPNVTLNISSFPDPNCELMFRRRA